MGISKILAKWYKSNRRELPWRNTFDPYKIWVSEIILQQTRVAQGTDYYIRFIDAFPDVTSLAKADIDEVLKLWQGLGYYTRARNMHMAAQEIVSSYHGIFPKYYDEIIRLKGIGLYTAAAVASLAFNHPVAAVDGNVIRVISRLFSIRGKKGSALFNKKIEKYACSLLDKDAPGQHNQAMIELGALVCTPVNPDCMNCPLNNYCQAFLTSKVQNYPGQIVKKPSRERYFYYYYIVWKDKFYIKKRTGKDIWLSLYELPLYESTLPLSEHEVPGVMFHIPGLSKKKGLIIKSISRQIKHVLSHQNIYARFIHVVSEKKIHTPGWLEIGIDEAEKYAFPVLIANYLELVKK